MTVGAALFMLKCTVPRPNSLRFKQQQAEVLSLSTVPGNFGKELVRLNREIASQAQVRDLEAVRVTLKDLEDVWGRSMGGVIAVSGAPGRDFWDMSQGRHRGDDNVNSGQNFEKGTSAAAPRRAHKLAV